MEVDGMNTIFFTNLQLLGMDIVAMEGKYHIPFSRDMFNLPNKAGSEAVLHFLFDRLNPTLFKEQFRDCWPVVDRKAEMQFRKVCNTWLSSIQADNPDAHLPRINASLLLSPGGRKFIHLLYKFSIYVLTQTMNKEHGFNMREALVYPVLTRTSVAEVMRTTLEDSCLQLHTGGFEQLHLTVAANRKWRESSDELVKTYRRLSRAKRDLENEKRQLVNTLAENAKKQSLPLPAKRTVSMFDSGQDVYSKHRGKRMEKARSEWNELHSFNEEIKKRRNILKSVLDTVSEKPAINGNDLGVQIPNLLLQEFQREIQMQEIDNVYKGGCLNLESVTLLWNMCLRRYKEQMESDVLPDIVNEIPAVKAQTEQYHANLMIAQKTRDETMNVIIPKIQDEMEKLHLKLHSCTPVRGCYDKSNNSPGLGLVAPTPPHLAFPSRSSETNDMAITPAISANLKNDTPGAISSVVDKIELSIHQNSGQTRALWKDYPNASRLEALKENTKAVFTGSVEYQTSSRQAVHRGAKLITKGDKEQISLARPSTTSKSSEQRKTKSSKNAAANTNEHTKTKESAEDALVNSIVDSMLEAETNHKDSWILELKSISNLIDAESHDQDQGAFVSKHLIHCSPQQDSFTGTNEHEGSHSSLHKNYMSNPYQENQSLKSVGNTPLWEQTSPASSTVRNTFEQPSDLFSPIASTSADSQTDSVASASNKSARNWSASVALSPVNSPLFSAREANLNSQVSESMFKDDSKSKSNGSEIQSEYFNQGVNDSFYKSLMRLPGDGQPRQETETSTSSGNSGKDETVDMESLSKDSLFDPITIDSEVSVSLNLLDSSSRFKEATQDVQISPLSCFENTEGPLFNTINKVINFEAAEDQNGSKLLSSQLHNISSEDLLDLESSADLLQGLDESFSPAKDGIVLESGRSPFKMTSEANHKMNSPVSGIFSSDSFTLDRTTLSPSKIPINTEASVNSDHLFNKSSDIDNVTKSGNDDILTQMALLQQKFASVVNKFSDAD